MTARPSLRALRPQEDDRRIGLIVRVSTDLQVRNPEGSLTTQLQRLRQQVALKQANSSVEWAETAVYELKGVSGKDSVRSPEFERLFADIRSGRVNTVMFTSLSRLCRSVRDFLQFVAFLEEHGANFISLKEDYDTTSAQGRLIITIMMALAEFEREQTAERTRDAFQARSERGLWNGGRLLGYDLDTERKGYLIPNETEAVLVNFAFDTYLECGSIARTADSLNEAGYRTKAYSSRRQVVHAGKAFQITTVQHMLKNVSYLGKKSVSIDGADRLVDAVWPAIVDDEKFQRVQELMAANGRSNRSVAKPVRHAHILSGGLLACGRCDSPMASRSGTGRGGITYFYYACPRDGCGLRVVAAEVEGAVLDRLRFLAEDEEVVAALVERANAANQRGRPPLEKQLRSHQRTLQRLREESAFVITRAADPVYAGSAGELAEHLDVLARQRLAVEHGMAETLAQLDTLSGRAVPAESIRTGLRNFARVYEYMRPYEKRELIRTILSRAQIGDRTLVLDVYETACAGFAQAVKSDSRSEPPIWLPEPGDFPNGLEFDVALYVDCGRKRTDGERRYPFSWDEPPEPMLPAPPRKRLRPNPVSVARDWQRSMEERGESKAELARRLGVTRARVTQVLKVLDLDPAVLAFVERNPDPRITERALRSIVHRPPQEQLTHVDQLLASTPRTKRRMLSGRRP